MADPPNVGYVVYSSTGVEGQVDSLVLVSDCVSTEESGFSDSVSILQGIPQDALDLSTTCHIIIPYTIMWIWIPQVYNQVRVSLYFLAITGIEGAYDSNDEEE